MPLAAAWSTLVSLEAQKLAAGVTLLSPFVPLLFMGEEYGETAPFLYFTSHGDKDLIETVRRGRQEEFASFGWNADVPDPQDETTFANSKLHQRISDKDPHRTLRLLYRELIHFRQRYRLGSHTDWRVQENESLKMLTVLRNSPEARLAMYFNFSNGDIVLPSAPPAGSWMIELNSADARWAWAGHRFCHKIQLRTMPSNLPRQSFVVLREEAPTDLGAA